MIIQQDLTYYGNLGSKKVHTLFDSGATISCISEKVIKGLEKPNKLFKPIEIGTAAVGTMLKINHYVVLWFDLEGHHLSDIFFIIPTLNADVVIGVDTLQKYHCKLDFKKGKVIVDPNAGKLMLM